MNATRRNMKKFFFLIIIGLLMTVITACGEYDNSDTDKTTSSSSERPQQKVLLLIIHENYAWGYKQTATIVDVDGNFFELPDQIKLSDDNWYEKLVDVTNSENSNLQISAKDLEDVHYYANKFNEYESFPLKKYSSQMRDYGSKSLYGIYLDGNGVPQYLLLSRYGDSIECIDNKDIIKFVNRMAKSNYYFIDKFRY